MVNIIEQELNARGISCFMDRSGINLGDDFAETISKAIFECKIMLFVWSENSNQSENTANEIALAIEFGKTIVPFKVGEFQPHYKLAYRLVRFNRVDVVAFNHDKVIELSDKLAQQLGLTVSGIKKERMEKEQGQKTVEVMQSHSETRESKISEQPLISSKPNHKNMGIKINGVTWATCNVDAPGSFAANPTDAGMFYQWNRKVGWSATDPMINSYGVTDWDPTDPEGDTWEKANDPSPAGWRVPTLEEIKSLLDTEKVTNEWTTLNGITGRRFTDIVSGNSIFLPAAGCRFLYDAKLYNADSVGSYWSSSKYFSAGYGMGFNRSNANQGGSDQKYGFNVRCVAEKIDK